MLLINIQDQVIPLELCSQNIFNACSSDLLRFLCMGILMIEALFFRRGLLQ